MGIAEDCRDLKLISMHVPKVGGSAIRLWLEKVYGSDAVYNDGNEPPGDPASPARIDPDGYLETFASGCPDIRGKQVVHGHFWIKKYQDIKDVPRVTFLRHPVERLISEYWNLKIVTGGMKRGITEGIPLLDALAKRYRVWNRRMRFRHKPMHAYFFRKNPGILEFARIPLKRRFYSFTYFGDVEPEIFDFIGDYARLPEELKRLSEFMSVDVEFDLPRVNVTSDKANGYRKFTDAVLNDPATIEGLRDLLADDIAFYEKYAGR